MLVTHRLTIAMRADFIYLMKDGEVVESGTHDELVRLRRHVRHSPGERRSNRHPSSPRSAPANRRSRRSGPPRRPCCSSREDDTHSRW